MRLAAAVTAALVLAATPALAQPSRTPPVQAPYQYQPPPGHAPPEGATETHRYGSTIALVDGVSFGAMMVGMIILVSQINSSNADDDDAVAGMALMLGGLGGYMFGGPLVHNSKGNSWGAWKSFGLRVGLPFLGAALGEVMAKEECNGDYCTRDEGPGASLSGVGVLSAMVIDWFVLAKVDRPVPRYAPYVSGSRDGDVTLGIAGSF